MTVPTSGDDKSGSEPLAAGKEAHRGRVRQQLKTLKKDLEAKDKALQAKAEELEARDVRLVQLEEEARQRQVHLEEATARVLELEARSAHHLEAAAAQAVDIELIEEECAGLERKLADTEAEVSHLRGKLEEAAEAQAADVAKAVAELESERDAERAAREESELALAESRAQLGAARDQIAELERAWNDAKEQAARAEALEAEWRAAEAALEETRGIVSLLETQVGTVTKALAAAEEDVNAERKSKQAQAHRPVELPPRRAGTESEKPASWSGDQTDNHDELEFQTVSMPGEVEEATEVEPNAETETNQVTDDAAFVPEVVDDPHRKDSDDLVDVLLRFLEPE